MNDRDQRFEKLILETYPNRCRPLTIKMEEDIYYGFQDGWKARQDEIDSIRNVCAEAYQLAGYFNAPIKALDNLSAAANGCKLPHESFLPLEIESELDKANARIAQLNDFLRSCINTAGYEVNGNMLSGEAKRLIAESSDTWLLEHDKAVEVKVLEELADAIDKYKNPDDSIGAAGLRNMAESRKSRK